MNWPEWTRRVNWKRVGAGCCFGVAALLVFLLAVDASGLVSATLTFAFLGILIGLVLGGIKLVE